MNKDKANGFIGFMSFMVNKSVLYCSSYSKMTVFETLDSERRRKWRHNVAKQLFLFVTARRGPETLLTAKRPAPGTPSCIKCPGFARGGMLAAGIDSHIMYQQKNEDATIELFLKRSVLQVGMKSW